MEIKRDSFVFYRSFFEAIQQIPRKHRAMIYEAVFEYVFENREPSLSGVPSALWTLIKPQLDANNVRYENGKLGAPYGKKGGRPRKTEDSKNPNGVITKTPKGLEAKTPNVNVNENVNENENVNVNVNAPAHPAATTDNTAHSDKPVFLEIAADIKTNGYDLDEKDIEEFIDFNDKLGWIGDWKRHLKSWAEHKKPKREAKPKGSFYNFDQHDKDMSGEEREIVLANMREAEDYEQRNMG